MEWLDGCGGVAWWLGLAGWVSAGSRSQPEQLSISNYFPINHCRGIAMPPGQPVKTIIVSYFQSSFQSLFCLPPMIGTCVHFQQPHADKWMAGWLRGCSLVAGARWVDVSGQPATARTTVHKQLLPKNHYRGIAKPLGQPEKTIIVSYFQSSIQSLFCLPPKIGTCVHFQQSQAENGWLAGCGVWTGGLGSLGGCQRAAGHSQNNLPNALPLPKP